MILWQFMKRRMEVVNTELTSEQLYTSTKMKTYFFDKTLYLLLYEQIPSLQNPFHSKNPYQWQRQWPPPTAQLLPPIVGLVASMGRQKREFLLPVMCCLPVLWVAGAGRNSFKNRTNIKHHQPEKKHFNPLPLMFSPLQLFRLQNETVILQVPCSTSSGYFLTPEITQLLQSLLVSGCIKGWLLLWVQRRSERIRRKRQMMCQRYGIKGGLHSHILPSPWEYTLNYRSLKAFFPMGIYTKLQIFESSFPINYVNIFLPNSGGTKKYFFPTSAALECSPVIAL